MLGQEFQIICELLCGIEVFHVDVGLWRQEPRDIRARVHDRDDEMRESVEQLLRQVVDAQSVLKGQIESVSLVKHVIALGRLVFTSQVPTLSVDVNVDELLKILRQFVTARDHVAVRHKPSCRFRLLADYL